MTTATDAPADAAVDRAARGRTSRSRALRSATACALVVFLNAAVWALVAPSFQVPDEPQHMAYAQYLAETGKLPKPIAGAVFSPEEGAAFGGVEFNLVVGNDQAKPPWTPEQDAGLEAALAADPSRISDGAGTNALNNPPLYYLVEAVPYHVFGTADFWTRLLAMRLTSALMMGLAALFVFLFVRELLPRSPLAWTAAALAAGLAPVAGYLGGAVNNDAGLALASAATLWALARAFRHGLDVRSGALVGACFGLGVLTKFTIAGFAPGLVIAAGALCARQWRTERRDALRGVAAAAGAIAVPLLAYVLALKLVWDRPLFTGGVGLTTVGGAAAATQASFRGMLSYIWQFYLPRLPWMSYDPHDYGLWDSWVVGWVGRFGWLDYTFPAWVYDVAVAVWAGLAALVVRACVRGRAVLRRRGWELAAYAGCLVGVLGIIAVQGYRYRVDSGGYVFEQARYLLPLLALYGAVIGVAVVGAGRRAAPAVGAAIVALTLVNGLAGLVLTLGRYYT